MGKAKGFLNRKRSEDEATPDEWPDTPTRRVEKQTNLNDTYSRDAYDRFDDGPNPNVVVSKLPNGLHAPAIDIDIPARLIPSKTRGHSHLYVDVQVEWEKYVRLLDAMVDCGIVEKAYRDMSVKDGMTVLRLPPDQTMYDTIRRRLEDGSDPITADL